MALALLTAHRTITSIHKRKGHELKCVLRLLKLGQTRIGCSMTNAYVTCDQSRLWLVSHLGVGALWPQTTFARIGFVSAPHTVPCISLKLLDAAEKERKSFYIRGGTSSNAKTYSGNCRKC